MIIIWGSRSYFRTNQTKQYGFCTHCGRFAKFKSWNGTTFFHLYYIPVIPLESRKRNHACCNHCDKMQQYELPDFEAVNLRLKEQAALALLAIQNSETTFVIDDTSNVEIDSLGFLESAIDWLYAANEKDFIQGILEQLRQPNCHYAEAIVLAEMATLDGQLDEAVGHYQSASRYAPTRYEPLQRGGHLLVERGKRELAIEAYRGAALLAQDTEAELPLQLQLVDQLMHQKRFIDAEKTYDRILTLHPTLGDDKAFSRLVAKARKKAAADRPTMAF